ncbi:Hypothetical_protein [Hexamita inflata]|uniref:Hypothetical_protein n=1 Tax=Hexamita inflata TaxID=28002 RepID=A0AA86UQH5_9EUKA|nr:Hypothetical protein HINF_LOCUS55350 [Hexamita inflata]
MVYPFACLAKLDLANRIAPPVVASASNWSSSRFLPKVVGTHNTAGYSHLTKISLQTCAAFLLVILGSRLNSKTNKNSHKVNKMQQQMCILWHASDHCPRKQIFFADHAPSRSSIFLYSVFGLVRKQLIYNHTKVTLFYLNAVGFQRQIVVFQRYYTVVCAISQNLFQYSSLAASSGMQYGIRRTTYTGPPKCISFVQRNFNAAGASKVASYCLLFL